jgi:hypothetical protein
MVGLALPAWADDTFVYAVQISATVQATPPQIALQWEPDPYGALSYTVYRKAKDDSSWGPPIASLQGSVTNYADTNVVVGATYEYQIVKAGMLGYTGYGYIYSGIQAPLVENRAKLILVIETNATASLSNELAQLQSDLVGDGWLVACHGISSNDTPDSVRSVITNEYYADPVEVNTVFLFGHVPILESGDLNYDTHETRPMPADAFYGDVNDDWPTDPSTSPSFLPSDVTLMVGRVDLFNMPGNGAPVPWPDETELLRNYLRKDHNWRHKLITVSRQALMGNSRGDDNGEATAASGYRNFEPFVGPGNTIEANVQGTSPPEQRWISMLSAGSWLWAYGNGGGSPISCGALGTNTVAGVTGYLYSIDVVAQDAKVVFVMLFGSWFGQWDLTDDLMRSFLATPTMGLTCCLAGVPHWFCHHMGLGETIGYSTRLSMNNSTLYQNQDNDFTRAVYVALMGDPALRMDAVAPATGLTATTLPRQVTLSWSASADPVLGYHVYRSDSPTGPFSRLTVSLVTNTSYSDPSPPPNSCTYMVRAVALQTTPSGTYFNGSQGVFATANPANAPSFAVAASWDPAGLTLSWNSSSGTTYRVLADNNFASTNWADVSGTIAAVSSLTTWIDTNANSIPQRFYRIQSP